MGFQGMAAQVLAEVQRARALFAASPEPLPSGQPLESAARSTVAAGQRAADLSGILVARHADFTSAQAQHLAAAGRTDTTLAAQLTSAATLTQTGARQLDTIVEQTRALAQTAPYARSPADQRMLLAALQARLNHANAVVSTTRQKAGAIAATIRALGYATGPGGVQPADFRPGEAPQDTPQRLPDDPEQFNEQWNRLSREDKDRLYSQDHSIGNHPGMPFADRDHYNRMHLDELQQTNQAELDRLRAAHPDWANGTAPFFSSREYTDWKTRWDAANHTQQGYAQVRKEIGPPPDRVGPGQLPRYLGLIDDKGHAAVSINNPDTAKRTATFVPGTGQDLPRFDASADKSERMYWAARNADRTLQPGDVSVTTWMGYDRPMSVLDAAHPSYAHNGAAALDDFQAGMRASHNDALAGGPSLNTVIGHSYGSTEVGAAALNGHHLDANNIVAVGSPGLLAEHASDLSLDAGAHVFATRAQNDIIGVATYFSLGPDPMAANFGGIPFEAAPGPAWPLGLPSMAAHRSYWDPGNPALSNMGRIIAGRVDVTPPTFTP